MSSAEIVYEGEGGERLVRALAAYLSDFRPFWPKLVSLFIEWMGLQFDSEGDFGGEPWAPLTADYAAAKGVRYPGKSILIASGDLRKAASMPTREMLPRELILTIDDSAMTHGGRVARSVAAYHQDGTDRIPPRPIVFGDPLPAAAQAGLDRIVDEYVAETVAMLGRV